MAVLYVGPVGGTPSAVSPDPYKCEYGLMDVSSDEAGRDLAATATMHKARICQKRKLSLAWQNPDAAATSRILTAFNPEYVSVRYWDAMDGEWQTRRFYVGDRSAPLRWFQTLGGTRYSELSFDIIEV